jgi:hypothetical protein
MQRLFASAILVALLSVVAAAQSTDPLVGTWKLNVAKSTGLSYKSGTTKIEPTGAGVKFDVELVSTDGTVHKWAFTANYDGKDNPVTGNSPYGDTVSLERVDAHTIRTTGKVAGKVVSTQTIVVSGDGKTRTTTTKGTDAKGQKVESVSFYEKQ